MLAELVLHRRCEEIALHPLDINAIEAYVQVRLRSRATQARELAPVLLERTGGTPLFMTSIVNQLIRAGVPKDAIVMEALSDEEPIYETVTARGIAANRRAEIFFDF